MSKSSITQTGEMTYALLHSAIVAELDEEKDGQIDYSEIKAEPLEAIQFI